MNFFANVASISEVYNYLTRFVIKRLMRLITN